MDGKVKLGIIANLDKPLAGEMLARAAAHAAKRGIAVVANAAPPSAPARDWKVVGDLSAGFDGVSAILVLGGDGTLLNAIRAVGPGAAPFLGVNIGTLGYLSAVEGSRIEEAIDAAAAGEIDISRRLMLAAEAAAATPATPARRAFPARALNEVVLYRSTGRVAHLSLFLDGIQVTNYSCDGVIVSTPTGSTAYSLSAGGPLVMPMADVLVITVICPHALSTRPIIVSGSTRVELRSQPGNASLSLAIDGADVGAISPGETLSVAAALERASIAFLKGHDDFEILARKLGWKGFAGNPQRKGATS